MGKRTPIGTFIHSSWINLNIRCGVYSHLQTQEKCLTYKNISINFTREQYKEICLLKQEHILSLKRPSLDRIDSSKNYTLDNIQFIELSDNIVKDKTVFYDNKGVCSLCKCEKDLQDFAKDKRRIIGRSSICKKCDSSRKKLKRNFVWIV